MADEKKNGHNEGTMRQKVTVKPRIGPTEPKDPMLQISSVSEILYTSVIIIISL